MDTVNTMQQKTQLQTTIERIQYYLKNSNLHDSTVILKNGTLVIHFPSRESEPVIPSTAQIQHIRGIVFWDNNIKLLFADDIFQYVSSHNYLRIDVRNYEISAQIYNAIKQFGVYVCGFDSEIDEICFYYKLAGRYHFTYDELDILQNIVNPSIKKHDSIRITGFDGSYTIRVSLNK